MTSTVAESVTDATLDLKLNLLLARLLIPLTGTPKQKDVRRDLAKAFGSDPSTETMADWIAGLRDEGLIGKGLKLTEDGRRKALEFLGTARVPPRSTWRTIVSRFLVPRALGINSSPARMQKKMAEKDSLAALLLTRRFALPASTGTTLNKVLEAIICLKLGYPQESTLKGLQTRKFEELIHSPMKLTADQAATQVPAKLLDAGKPGVLALQDLVLREWTASHANPEPRPSGQSEPVDLGVFARTVLAVARSCPTGWFGDNKVFINHVYRNLNGEPSFHDMTLDEFKRKLVEANRTDRLTLSRADLVSVMDPEDVRQSETHQLDAVFHFILVQKERP